MIYCKFRIFTLVKAKFKIVIASLLLFVVVFSAIPKSYIHSLLGHTHNISQPKTDVATVSENQETQDCNFEKFDTPVYYTVFKFILNFLPITTSKETSFNFVQQEVPNTFYSISFLRGPPLA